MKGCKNETTITPACFDRIAFRIESWDFSRSAQRGASSRSQARLRSVLMEKRSREAILRLKRGGVWKLSNPRSRDSVASSQT